MSSNVHKVMSLILVGSTLCIGGWIALSQPEEWLLTSLFFSLLSLGLWFGLKAKRDALAREIRIQDDSPERKAAQHPQKDA